MIYIFQFDILFTEGVIIMDNLRQELIDAIVEVSMSTGIATYDCIRQAKEILDSKQNYIEKLHLQMFAKW